MSITIPPEKLDEVLQQVSGYNRARSMTKKNLQSLLGKLLHVAKCVHPARLFVSRLLEALRMAKGKYINVTSSMRADFRWFTEFCSQWNGKSYIPAVQPAKDIYVDACLSGVGGSDGGTVYAGQVTPTDDGAANITELEAINVIVALHTFLGTSDSGTHVRVHCDNLAAVQVLQAGRGQNKILLDCARAAWMVQAILDIQITYVHVPGVKNEVADALSRQHMDRKAREVVDKLVTQNSINVINPCLYVFDMIPSPLLSRSGHRIITGQGEHEAGKGARGGHQGQPEGFSKDLHRLRETCQVRPNVAPTPNDMCLHRVPRPAREGTSNDQEQGQPHTNIHQARRWQPLWNQPPTRAQSDRGAHEGQTVLPKDKATSVYGSSQVGHIRYSKHSHRYSSQGGNTGYVLRYPATAGGRPSQRETVRPKETPNTGRYQHAQKLSYHKNQMGKEYAEGRSVEAGHVGTGAQPKTVPSKDFETALRPHPNSLFYRPPADVPHLTRPHSHIRHKLSVDRSLGLCGRGQKQTLTAQPQKGCSDRGPLRWLR